MVDVAEQRTNMVESQILTSDVTDRNILRAVKEIPRERFVPPAMAALAYMDEAIPLDAAAANGARRWLMAPRIFAKLLQLADIGAADRVLDVGCGMGYSAAVLGKIAGAVIALEVSPVLAGQAKSGLEALGLDNVTVVTGDLVAGCPEQSPYNAIIVEGAIAEAPGVLLDQLKDGGHLVAVVCRQGPGQATLWQRSGRVFDRRIAFDAAAPLLPGFQPAAEFVF